MVKTSGHDKISLLRTSSIQIVYYSSIFDAQLAELHLSGIIHPLGYQESSVLLW